MRVYNNMFACMCGCIFFCVCVGGGGYFGSFAFWLLWGLYDIIWNLIFFFHKFVIVQIYNVPGIPVWYVNSEW